MGQIYNGTQRVCVWGGGGSGWVGGGWVECVGVCVSLVPLDDP